VSNQTGNVFIEQTKYSNLSPSGKDREVPRPPVESTLPDGAAIPLSRPEDIDEPGIPWERLVAARRSLRKYAKTPLSADELSYLLWNTQGVTKLVHNAYTLRTVPSAGACHAFETVLVVQNVEGIEPGIYRYAALDHKLIRLGGDSSSARQLARAANEQVFIGNAAVVFAWIAVPSRLTWKYAERGFRYLYLDAGHVCQNLYLGAQAIGGGACAIGAFDDDAVNEFFDVDGETEFVIYMGSVGKSV